MSSTGLHCCRFGLWLRNALARPKSELERAIRLQEVIELQRRCHGSARLAKSVGDGYLYLNNPFFRRIRDATLRAGFRFTLEDERGYFGFPLIHLDSLLCSRKIPYRPSLTGLLHLEASRPGFFTLADLHKNRPAPNYLLHESAHAVAFHALFGRPTDVAAALSEPDSLAALMLGEAFAMTSEYFAACAVQGRLHGWFFSVSSYRHRTQRKRAVGELLSEHGFDFVGRCVMLAFFYNNFLVDRLSPKLVEKLSHYAEPAVARGLKPAELGKLGRALNGLMLMNPEFRYDTARLFLTMFGRSRNIRRELSADPLQTLALQPQLRTRVIELVGLLGR